MSYSNVTEFIKDKYGIHIEPGKKGECFKCHKNTMSVKRDGTLAKCFHPACEVSITLKQINGNYDGRLSEILGSIMLDFHKELLETVNEGYEYLINNRELHPKVIAGTTMIGIIPKSYDVSKKFKDILDVAEAAFKSADTAYQGSNNRRQQARLLLDLNDLENKMANIKSCMESLKDCCTKHQGHLVFASTNNEMEITEFKIRKPYSRIFATYKLSQGGNGVFGLELFSNSIIKEKEIGQVIQVEGQINLLALQTLWLKVNELKGNDIEEVGYIDCISIGSSSNPDFKTIRKVDSHPIVFYDADEAGFSVVVKERQFMHISAICTPSPFNDIDEYIRSFGEDIIAAWNSVVKLIIQRKYYYRYFEVIANEVEEERKSEHAKDFQINKEVAELIINDLRERSVFYKHNEIVYLFDIETKKLFAVNDDSTDLMLLLHKYGINRAENLYKYMLHEIRAEGLTNGQLSEIHKFSYYKPETYTLYLYNNASKVYKINSNKIELVDNGTDGILFIGDNSWEPFEIVDIKQNHSLLDEVILNKINFEQDRLCKEERKLLFKVWMESLFFENIMPTKPIMVFVGEKGSGKSISLRKTGMLLFGKEFNVTPLGEKPSDFDAAAINAHLLVIDNADSKCGWIDDKLATYATGASIETRKLYTNNEVIRIRPRCFLAITSRTPYFRRDDVADRLIIMRVERYKEYRPENEVLQEVLENRNPILSEIIYSIQKLIKVFQDKNDETYSTSFRMGDFAAFFIKAGEAEGKQNEVSRILNKLVDIQNDFTTEMDPLIDLLSYWIAENHGKAVTYEELFRGLYEIAERYKIRFNFASSRSFSQKMGSMKESLSKIFDIKEQNCGGHIIRRTYTLKPNGIDYSNDSEVSETIEKRLF